MKKIKILILMLLFFHTGIYAIDIGLGYNNGGVTTRVWWNERIGSELSLSFSYDRSYSSGNSIDMQFIFYLMPINYNIITSDFWKINTGLKFKGIVLYNYNQGYSVVKKTDYSRLHNYGLYLNLPEIEIAIPYINNLKIIGAVGVGVEWAYNDRGVNNIFQLKMFATNLSQFGIVYFFNTPAVRVNDDNKPLEKEEKN